MSKKHLYNPGDLLVEYWLYDGKEVNVSRYIVINKKEVSHCEMRDIGYTTYMCYVMYTHDPWDREDRNGLLDVGEIHEIVHWNDMDAMSYWYPTDRLDVVESGLLWDEGE